jgi:hypothetical protein
MKSRISHHGAVAALATALVVTGLGSSLASTARAASPSLSLTATDAVVGQTIHANAQLSESPGASGEISFEVFGPGDPSCAGPALTPAPGAATVAGEGQYASGDFTPPSAGTYSWSAHYPGDLENDAADSTCAAISTVGKASPSLAGVATSTATVGEAITDSATLAGGFAAGGELFFRAYGPDDPTCGTPKYEERVAVSGDGSYSPPGFAPAPGLYRWTVEYEGDANNERAELTCGAANQSSAVGAIEVTLAAGATGGTVGNPVNATATIGEGGIPAGQITFSAFSPGDANCSGAPAFSSAIDVSGNGTYRSAAFVPSRVGTFRWIVAYSGDAIHTPATVGCGKATSSISQASPSISGNVSRQLRVGTPFRDTATLQGGYAPAGTITFRVYGPVAAGCVKPLFVDTVAVAGNSTVRSDPFVAPRPGRYSFVTSYSGDSRNRGVSEPCDSVGQAVRVRKRAPKVKPRALLMGGRRISLRAHLSGAASPSGVINFSLYRPGDKRCRRKPAFSGGITVKSNGNYLLAEYLATESGTYRLRVGYSGDPRNQRYEGSCGGAPTIRVH